MDFNIGGKKVIDRLIEASDFNTRQDPCDHLGVSKTRYMRGIFPAGRVLQCAMETSASLEWLSFMKWQKHIPKLSNTSITNKKMLIEGKFIGLKPYIFHNYFLPKNISKLLLITDSSPDYICDEVYEEVCDGKWVMNIEGSILIRFLISSFKNSFTSQQ